MGVPGVPPGRIEAAEARERVLHAFPSWLFRFGDVFAQAGKRVWAVGGCTRDAILGRQLADFDCATDARPEEVIKLFRRVIPTGIDHGTVTVLWQGHAIEVTTLRAEVGHSDARHPDAVHFHDDIAADLARRDFTINAIALSLDASPTLIDPFEGLADLYRGLLRAVGDPLLRFSEDGLRPLRAARFASQLNFTVEDATRDAMGQTLAAFAQVSRERVRDELLKLLQGIGVVPALALLESQGLDALMLPAACLPMPTVQWETLPDLEARLVACLAKAPRRQDASAALTRLKLPNVLSRSVIDGLAALRLLPLASAAPVELRHFLATAGTEAALLAARVFPALEGGHHATCAWPDVNASAGKQAEQPGINDVPGARVAGTTEAQTRVTAEQLQSAREGASALSVRELAVGGRQVMTALGRAPGPWLGECLSALLEAVIEAPERNSEAELLRLAHAWQGSRSATIQGGILQNAPGFTGVNPANPPPKT